MTDESLQATASDASDASPGCDAGPAAGTGRQESLDRPSPARASAAGALARRTALLVESAARTRAQYQAAVFRIGLASTVAAFLLREWPNRRVLYGDRSPWALDLARRMQAQTHALTMLTWVSGRWWFELVYHATIAAAVLLALGWRTRGTSVAFMLGVLSIINRNTLVTDGGDNIIQIMVIYLVFTRCGRVWSLDARRARRHGAEAGQDRAGRLLWLLAGVLLVVLFGLPEWGWPAFLWTLWQCQGWWRLSYRRFRGVRLHALLDAAAGMVHNCAMLVIAVQVCLIYATAGWYKVQGSRWQEGTALYYPLHMAQFTPWPMLSGILGASMPVVLLLCYGTVILQVGFPFVAVNRRLKNVLVPMVMLEHLGIAVVLGLPFLSLTALVCDCVFLPTAFLVPAGGRCRASARWLLERIGGSLPRPALLSGRGGSV